MMTWWKLILGLPADIGLWLLVALHWIAVPPDVGRHEFPMAHFFVRCAGFGLLCGWLLGGWIRSAGFEPPLPGIVCFFSLVLLAIVASALAGVSLMLSVVVNERWPRRTNPC